jgi:sulfate transport system substrate-binding protein
VRKGNPKAVRDWDDLARPGVSVITPNPKTSGGARWNYLAAWGHALRKPGVQVITPHPKTSGGARWNFLAAWGYARKLPGGTDDSAKAFVKELFKHVPVLDTGARGATNTFVQRGVGDVLLAWENEAFLAQKELGKDAFEIVAPSISILAEPPVAVVDKNAQKHGTQAVAEAYLKFLYTPAAQEIIARNFYRPRLASVEAKYSAQFPKLKLFTIDDTFGGWRAAQKRFFADGGVFDQIGPGS